METRREKTSLLPLLLFALLCAGAVYGILLRPLSRQVGLLFRNTLYVFPLLLIVSLAANLVRNRFAKAVLYALLFAAVLLPYSGLINSGLSDQYALGGVIPWSDAFTMQLNTQRFLYGGMMGQASAIRPISTVFYALFLRLTDNNYFALQVFLCVLTALCLLIALREASASFGPVCAAFAYTILYYYIRQRLGTFMTEQYGFICSLLCASLLFNGIRTKKQLPMMAGFVMLSIAENARPAAMFLFPALGLWYFFVFVKGHKHRFLLSCAALICMLSGFALNAFTQGYVYEEGKSIPNRQAAEMIYGLCLGGESWGDVVGTDEMIALNDSENVIKDLAGLCVPILKEHPENILSALRTIFVDSLIESEYYGAFSYVRGNPARLQTVFRYGLMALWAAGFIFVIIKRKEQRYSFLLVAAIGIILSECAAVPFSSNYLRLYAASMWVPAVLTGLLPEFIVGKIYYYTKITDRVPNENGHIKWSYLFTGFLAIAGVVAPVYVGNNPPEVPAAEEILCDISQSVLVTSVDEGSFIYLKNTEDLDDEHIPNFRLPFVRQHFHDTASIEMFDFTDAIDTPTAIIRGIDLENFSDALIFAPLELVEGKTGTVQFCGHYIDPPILRDDRFFIPESAYFFEDEL